MGPLPQGSADTGTHTSITISPMATEFAIAKYLQPHTELLPQMSQLHAPTCFGSLGPSVAGAITGISLDYTQKEADCIVLSARGLALSHPLKRGRSNQLGTTKMPVRLTAWLHSLHELQVQPQTAVRCLSAA